MKSNKMSSEEIWELLSKMFVAKQSSRAAGGGSSECVRTCACCDGVPDGARKKSRRVGWHKVVEQPPWKSEEEMAELKKEIDRFRQPRTFVDTIRRYVREQCESDPAQLYRSCGVSRSVYSHLMSDPDREVAKETIVALAFGMKLRLREAEMFLREAGLSFSRRRKDDCVYIACFHYGFYNTKQINVLLEQYGVKKRLPEYFE